MDVLTLCWTFDSRWVFNVELKLYMIWVPVIVDLLTLIAYSIQQELPGCCSTKSSEAILGLIILGHICLVTVSYIKTLHMKNNTVYGNKQQIDKFIYRYNVKKSIWSIIGLFIATMAFILLLLECCEVIVRPCGTAFVILRTILDIGCWLYMATIGAVFFVCKLTYLLWAWKFPQSYLRYRQVVI